jgi:hypothetical protein
MLTDEIIQKLIDQTTAMVNDYGDGEISTVAGLSLQSRRLNH